jgi:hypothetical protein
MKVSGLKWEHLGEARRMITATAILFYVLGFWFFVVVLEDVYRRMRDEREMTLDDKRWHILQVFLFLFAASILWSLT